VDDDVVIRNEDRDALHILPLGILEFETGPVRHARLIKNARLESVVELFQDPDTQKVRKKLQMLSDKLSSEIQDVPLFLEDYGDVFLSLSYYRQCMEKLEPQIDDFLESITEIRGNYQLRQNLNLIETCKIVEYTMNSMLAVVTGRFETFERYTSSMWKSVDAARFRQVKCFIEDYHTTIGATLCAVTVKMAAWTRLFPNKDTGACATFRVHCRRNETRH